MVAELATSITATESDRLLQAEALVRAYCRWHVAPTRAGEEVTLPASGGSVLLLPSLYVTDVTSIVDEDGTTLVEDDDYTWQPNGVLTRTSGWWRAVTVTFTHGHDDPPPEVTAIVQSVAQRAVDNPGSIVRVQDGPFSETYSQTGFNQSLPMALLDAEKAVLQPYRIPGRP